MFERKTQYRQEAQFLVGWVISQVMARKVQPTYTPEEVKAAFKVFETPAVGMPPGHVKTSVLERALTTYGSEKLTLEEAQDLLSQVPHQICVCMHVCFCDRSSSVCTEYFLNVLLVGLVVTLPL